MSNTTTSILAAPVQESFNQKLLAVPTPNFIHSLMAMKKRMPAQGGTTARFRRYNPLPVAMVPLGNSGITPPGMVATAIDIDAKMSFYGSYVQINEQVTLQSQDPVMNAITARLGIQMRQTEDQLTRDMLASSASFINCTSGVNGDNPTNLTMNDVDTVIQALVTNNALTITDQINGENKFGTAPVRDAYFALCNSALISNFNSVNGFIQKANYPSSQNVLRSEWGAINGMRFLISSIGSYTSSASLLGNTVYNIFCMGMDAYAIVEQDKYTAQFIYRAPMYDGPLALNSTVGWKMAQVPRILNDLWLTNLRCTLA